MGQLEASLADDPTLSAFVYGLGPAMVSLNAMVAELSRTNIPVLILGESGSGKDAYARLIHRLSQQGDQYFWRINCAATEPADLLAQVQKAIGKLLNHEPQGSIYLDNIQELDPACQRVLPAQLPEAEITNSTDVFFPRLISSATRSLESEVETARFRRELYFRLNGACLRLPPLRERRDDIPILLEYFLRKKSNDLKKKVTLLSKKATQTLIDYHWPGNIRELEHFAEKIVVLGDAQMALNDMQAARIVNHSPMAIGSGASLKVAARAASKEATRANHASP